MEKLKCKRCDYEWTPKKEGEKPKCCPRCKSYIWNRMNRDDIKRILMKEIKRHDDEITRHKIIGCGSRTQRDNITKHFHKKFQTKLIARLMGFKVCDCCGNFE